MTAMRATATRTGRRLVGLARNADAAQARRVLTRYGVAGTARKVAEALRAPERRGAGGGQDGWPAAFQRGEVPEGAIDVKELLGRYSIEELAATAEQYFQANSGNPDYFYAKPLYNVDEAPDHLTCFAQMLGVLRPLPGMRVLDFGAGTCWTSRALAQLGCEVTASDVSPTALKFGEELFRRQPPAGDVPPPRFAVFDGRRLDLPDGGVDRILCFDAFHHLPNQDEILAEWFRVLRDGGIVGLSEPGPRHSLTGQSQFEMRNYTVIENDIVMPEIVDRAKAAGFTRCELAVFHVAPFTVPLEDYADLVRGGPTSARYLDHVRDFAANRYNFFLFKGEHVAADSRDRRGLAAELRVDLDDAAVPAGGEVTGRYTVRNTGPNHWLTRSAGRGLVQLGVHLFDETGRLLDRDHARIPLPAPRGVGPGEKVTGTFRIPAPGPGSYRLAFDVVSELVCWFEINGARVVELPLSVAGGG
jgi:SAM-dependent methyltransferase